jgi:oxygen-independent coproporphyrinogen-3 oxidase
MSLYQLTIEPGTRFETLVRQGAFIPLDEDGCADLFAFTRRRAAAAGLPAYEVSNHARAGEESRHNLTYWRYHDYAGIGPGAHGRRGGQATVRHRKPENWLHAVAQNGHGLAEVASLVQAEQACEALLMGLRLAEGIDPGALAQRFALTPERLINPLKLSLNRDHGLVWQNGGRIGVTETGMPVLNTLLTDLVAAGLITQ